MWAAQANLGSLQCHSTISRHLYRSALRQAAERQLHQYSRRGNPPGCQTKACRGRGGFNTHSNPLQGLYQINGLLVPQIPARRDCATKVSQQAITVATKLPRYASEMRQTKNMQLTQPDHTCHGSMSLLSEALFSCQAANGTESNQPTTNQCLPEPTQQHSSSQG